MLGNLVKKVFGSRNDRLVKEYGRAVQSPASVAEALSALSDSQLQAKTDEFKARLADEGTTLDDLMPEAFACLLYTSPSPRDS